MVNTIQIGDRVNKIAKCACLPYHFLWASTICNAIKRTARHG